MLGSKKESPPDKLKLIGFVLFFCLESFDGFLFNEVKSNKGLEEFWVVEAEVVEAGVVEAEVVEASVVEAEVVEDGVVEACVVEAGVVEADVVEAWLVEELVDGVFNDEKLKLGNVVVEVPELFVVLLFEPKLNKEPVFPVLPVFVEPKLKEPEKRELILKKMKCDIKKIY